jgi:hypothetical protein
MAKFLKTKRLIKDKIRDNCDICLTVNSKEFRFCDKKSIA